MLGMADDDVDFVVAVPKRKVKPIKFRLDGSDHVFSFTPPKDASALMPIVETKGDEDVAAMKGQFDWLSAGLSEEDNKLIMDRLKDLKDDFDFDNLEGTVKLLIKAAGGGRPTG